MNQLVQQRVVRNRTVFTRRTARIALQHAVHEVRSYDLDPSRQVGAHPLGLASGHARVTVSGIGVEYSGIENRSVVSTARSYALGATTRVSASLSSLTTSAKPKA